MTEVPRQQVSRERFEMMLLEIRNGAQLTLTELAIEGGNESVVADIRAVWHAAEVALGILKPGYVPKREALTDVERMQAWLDGADDEWPDVD